MQGLRRKAEGLRRKACALSLDALRLEPLKSAQHEPDGIGINSRPGPVPNQWSHLQLAEYPDPAIVHTGGTDHAAGVEEILGTFLFNISR